MSKILVIEDEKHIAEGLKLNLSLQGHVVEIASNGIDGLQTWKSWKPDLIVLDIMMPGIDGFAVLEQIRKEDEVLPVLILSARDSSKDKVHGFSKGVDDYLAKPFDLEEFLLRIERLLKRSGWSKESKETKLQNGINLIEMDELKIFNFGENQVDFIKSLANGREGEITLTIQELKLLQLFISNPDKPLSRKDLLEFGWGYHGETSTRTIDNFIVRFRKYFEDDPKNPLYFKSMRSVGYVFHIPQ